MHEVIPGARVEGEVLLDGEDIYASTVDPVEVRRTIGMVFQRPNPFPTMSIRDNVVAGMKLQGEKNKGRLDEICERSLRAAQPVERGQGPAGQARWRPLPAGQQQRLCIARAIAVQPDVLLMDEALLRASTRSPRSPSRDLIGELKKDYTIVNRHAQHASRPPRVSDQTAFFNLRATGEPRPASWRSTTTDKIFSNPTERATEDYISGRFG